MSHLLQKRFLLCTRCFKWSQRKDSKDDRFQRYDVTEKQVFSLKKKGENTVEVSNV